MATKEVTYSAFFDKLVQRVPGVQAALVTDHEGVVLVKSLAPGFDGEVVEESQAALFAVATEQASKLSLGKNKSIVHYHKEHIVVHINQLPLVVTFIGTVDANVGTLLALAPDVSRALAPLASSVASMENDDEAALS